MGMYDTVRTPCPECGFEAYLQSKSGDCILASYDFCDVPLDVLQDINRHTPEVCEKCETPFVVEIRTETEREVIGDGVITINTKTFYNTVKVE